VPMSAALSSAHHANTTRAAYMTGSVSTTTTAMSAAATMHFSKSGGRKSQCQSRDVKNCSHDGLPLSHKSMATLKRSVMRK
jgi:hypothetical protein